MSQPDPQPLAGRSVVLTGSSRGIGLEVARAYAAAGAAVVVNGRDPDAVREAAASIGDLALPVAGSAADPKIVALMVDAARSAGDLATLVCVAGTAEPEGSSILDVSVDDWHELIDAHLTSTFLACRAVAPVLVERGGGSIVTTTSHAFTGSYGGTGYAAGKGGVVSLTYALAAELREHGVRVNSVSPGATTRLSTGSAYEEQIERLHRRGLLDDMTKLGALDPGSAAHAAALYLYLGTDAAADLTGQVLVAAGGYLGRFPHPAESMITWRDHHVEPPYTLEEVHAHLHA
ncbi:SDR family NAD(P)-dependent oxidoreductase [Nocardioides acrostichi]|uniref:SDR family oxidoreductase n=1 Tax=Nocardioides acrostichi TaxID=2784339 RepID=A0A930UXN5_9ACTN|nr:SDR family NAD(P)-dependent oxidoreductase [Nocardioides acrostichi]MBF4162778.1 SDR family oxidoreductase [Nocardioides acrostichi]